MIEAFSQPTPGSQFQNQLPVQQSVNHQNYNLFSTHNQTLQQLPPATTVYTNHNGFTPSMNTTGQINSHLDLDPLANQSAFNQNSTNTNPFSSQSINYQQPQVSTPINSVSNGFYPSLSSVQTFQNQTIQPMPTGTSVFTSVSQRPVNNVDNETSLIQF